MGLISVIYLFLVCGFLLCVTNDLIEQKCENKYSVISLFSFFYLIFSIPFYFYYNQEYDSIYLVTNAISLILFIYAFILHDCEEPAVIFYGCLITFVIFSCCIMLVRNKIINKTQTQIQPIDLSEFDIVV